MRLDSDILENRKNIWSYTQRSWGNLGFVIYSTHKGPLAVTARVQ